MRLHIEKNEIESSGIIQAENFSIGDMGFVLEILRNKLYSNIKKAICREYSCNARDAHREVGTDNVPIKITLPNALESNWRCRDYGPGISPERMSNVFIKYGVSTKRDSDIQVGTFGIGAKSSFGYTDSFIINTFIDGIHRSYSAVIDDSRCGKLVLLSETSTTEPSGTEIVVPVKNTDINEFWSETEKVCRHWDVKPIICGGKIVWEEHFRDSIVVEGTDWFMAKNSADGNKNINIIVDGIEYPLDVYQTLGGNDVESPLNYFNYGSSLFLEFKTGTISISANREQIELDEKTKKSIKKVFGVVKKELQIQCEKKLEKMETYLDANLCFRDVQSTFNMQILKDCKWKGLELFGQNISLLGSQIVSYSNHYGKISKDSKYPSTYITLDKKFLYCLTDLDFNKSLETGVKKIFEKNPGYNKIFMIRCSDFEIKKNNVELLGLLNFSDFHTYKSHKASLNRLLFFKYNESYETFNISSFKEFENDTSTKKIWCNISKIDTSYSYGPKNGLVVRFNNILYSQSKNTNLWKLVKKIAGTDKVSLYGFSTDIPKDRVQEAVEDLESLDEMLENHLNSNDFTKNEIEFASKIEIRNNFLFSMEDETEYGKNLNKIENPNSLFVSYVQESNKLVTRINELKKYEFLLGCVIENGKYNTPQKAEDFFSELEKQKEVLTKAYPLIKYFTFQRNIKYQGSVSREARINVAEFIDYVNQCDKISS